MLDSTLEAGGVSRQAHLQKRTSGIVMRPVQEAASQAAGKLLRVKGRHPRAKMAVNTSLDHFDNPDILLRLVDVVEALVIVHDERSLNR